MQALSWIIGGVWVSKPRSAPQGILTIEEIHANLREQCQPPTAGAAASGRRISQNTVRNIQTYLQIIDSRAERYDGWKWTRRPRIYAILNGIGATSLMDDFIRENLTDFNLPFNEQTLPRFVGENVRQSFFTVQGFYLTNIKDIESEKSLHMMLPDSGDVYFVPERPLGQGGYGCVDLVFSRLSIEKFARKRVLRCRGSEQSQHSLIRELQELRKLDHRHLVHIIGSYSDPHYIAYLMKPVADLTLADFLNTPHTLGTKDKLILRRFYGCLAGAMNYLFTQGVRHRDFTARNILIDSACEVYISDFGSSYNWSSKANSKTRHRNVPTSSDYMAPELAKGGEHGTKSDMWSLGLVYLEMTTKLLEHRPSDMRRRIRDAASKNKCQPYPYANLPVIQSWMQLLGSTGSDSDYDREPLSWIRELLYAESEHRLTTAQLMKYILESPSFGVFCCLKCQDDFQSESFAYSSPRPAGPVRKDSNGESKRTRETVEAFFESDSADYLSRGLSEKRTDSIEQWIQDAAPSDFEMAELPGTGFPEGPVGDDEDELLPPDNMFSDQLLYSSYEYEYYNPSGTTTRFLDSSPGGYFADNQIASQDSEPVELLADTSWGADPETQTLPASREEEKEVLLRDSGLGFLEYVSDSSDSEKALQLFEEVSDRSSLNSGEEEEDVAALRDDPLCSFLTEESPAPKRFAAPGDSFDALFDEEVDLSDVENLWDEASDRSEPEVVPQALALGSRQQKAPEEGAEETVAAQIIDEPEVAITAKEEENQGLADADKPFSGASDGKETTGGQPNMPQVNEPLEKTQAKAKAPNTEEPPRTTKSVRVTPVREKPAKRARIAVPEIVIELAADSPPQSPKHERFSPRKRDALVPADVRKLMDNTWEMASSAPTSIVSEGSMDKISRFFFLIPNEAQIESLLSMHCKKGSAHAVRVILEKTTSPKKPLRPRQFFMPLMHAVRGASSRHNKCVRELLAAGVNPNSRTKTSGVTPLHVALEHKNFKGYANLVWLLLNGTPPANPNRPDRSGELPLSTLFTGPDTEPLELHRRGALIMLLKADARPDFKLPGTGNTPLHSAVRRRDPVAVAMLLYKGADVNAENSSGTTPLQITANQFRRDISDEHAEVLDHLLDPQYKVKVDQPAGALERTPLHWAVIAGCPFAVNKLLDAGAEVKRRDKDRRDAMGLAISNVGKILGERETTSEAVADHAAIMRALVEKGAGKGWMLEEGRCLVETAVRGDGKLLESLLSYGLSASQRYGEMTVEEYAKRYGSEAARWTLQVGQ
ncbi:hypothetical protein QBC39DRAFT_175057 [Podospora conica]|nr:hypothetical protein QBC39DRAFT_175057 [Schizothecium conicum]